MPRFEVALTITVHDAEVQDVQTLLDQFRTALGEHAIIQTIDPKTSGHLEAIQRVPGSALRRSYRGWLSRREEILRTLEETGGNIAESARRLKVTRGTMMEWARRCGYERPSLSA